MAARGFVNRLVHLGYHAYLIGDISTPLARKDDTVLLISNSGNTNSLYAIAERVKKDGAKILSITSNKNSKIFEISDFSLILKGLKNLFNLWEVYLNRLPCLYLMRSFYF